jgi:hypothetical protein
VSEDERIRYVLCLRSFSVRVAVLNVSGPRAHCGTALRNAIHAY